MLTEQLKNISGTTPFVAITLIEAYFRGQTVERDIRRFLPMLGLALPIEIDYALLERFPPPALPLGATPPPAK